MKTDETKQRKEALKWLAVVRRTEVDTATAAAYLTGLSDLPAWAVAKACREIGYKPRGEYETGWPELGLIRAHALAEMKIHEQRLEAKRLQAPVPDPISPEKWDDISKRFAEAIGRKSMR